MNRSFNSVDENVQQINPFFYSDDGVEGTVDEVLHHHLQILHPVPKPYYRKAIEYPKNFEIIR